MELEFITVEAVVKLEGKDDPNRAILRYWSCFLPSELKIELNSELCRRRSGQRLRLKIWLR
jgi:hypothetical protein